MKNGIFLGTDSDNKKQHLLLPLANRHGLITGSTGTGKTVTMQILCEGFSKAGVPVFAADVKGDLSGISQAGSADHKLHDKLLQRAMQIGMDTYDYEAMPTVFWDLYGEQGHPVRTTISEMGPTLLARLMGLNETQEGILTIAFEIADDEDMLLLDMKDLRAMLNFINDNRDEVSREYGNASSQSVGAIMRQLLKLERAGADEFFAEPALDLKDFMKVDAEGRGIVNILAADKLITSPDLYSTFLLWLLSELFEELPEVGNPEKPKMVFFFDEAHLLFEDAPKALLDKIEQVARLIRSKGVGIYFVTQNPADIPDDVLGQLGNRIQHALRAYTPKEQKSIRAAASSFRENPAFKTEDVITDLGVGEALISTLDIKGVPNIVSRTMVRPPASRLGPAESEERAAIIAASDFKDKYTETVDRESAYEILEGKTVEREEEIDKAKEAEEAEDAAKEKAADKKAKEKAEKEARDAKAAKEKAAAKKQSKSRRGKKSASGVIAHEAKLMARQLVRSQGRRILRGVLGGLMRR